ncbi:MAG TPA: acetylxylan esterase, partial [Candidatus Paceibacterota bacterium]|nr:acetylxylan esterase [Candidatus Paceibacterota bacterium]
AWSGDAKAQTKIRRRFMALGQTADGMRVWDIRCAVKAIHQVRDNHARIELRAQGSMAVNALYAALFEPTVTRLDLRQLPASQLAGPDYLGVLRICDLTQVIDAVKTQAEVNSETTR